MITVDTGSLAYTFGPYTNPAASVRHGDVLHIRTEDCFGGAVRSASDRPSQVVDLARVNPITGPIEVHGARPGDTLALHFADIRPSRDWGVSCLYPHFGALTGSHDTPTLQPALPELVWFYELDDAAGTASMKLDGGHGKRVTMPMDPMFGTVGVAPGGEVSLSTLDCGSHGGNLDLTEVRAGATVFLPVMVPGALFGIGDGHARQGHGELCGVAIETAMQAVVLVGLIPAEQQPAGGVRIWTDDYMISVGTGRPAEDAIRAAGVDMVRWLSEWTGWSQFDVYQLVSQLAVITVGNVCDPHYSVAVKIPHSRIPTATPSSAYELTHQELCDKAATARRFVSP